MSGWRATGAAARQARGARRVLRGVSASWFSRSMRRPLGDGMMRWVGGFRALAVPVALCIVLFCAGCERPWQVAVMGDADLGRPGEPVPPVFPRVLAAVREQAPDLVFFTGDLVHGRTVHRADTLEQVRLAAGWLAGLGPRCFAVPGNHDVDGAGGREAFEAHFGRTPWVFLHRGWRFIGLDTEEPGMRGEIAGEQLRWLREQLGSSGSTPRTVLFMHRPVWPTALAAGRTRSLPRPDLHELLVRGGVAAVFAGHEHRFHQEVRDGVLYVITGGAGAPLVDGAFHHFALVEMRGRRLGVRAVLPARAGTGQGRDRCVSSRHSSSCAG